MNRAALLCRTVAGVLLIAAASPGQEGRPHHGPDFKVVIWYSQGDPLGTFRYQIYDVRKGEYTDAVDAWLARVKADYPSYIAFVRNVVLEREKGATEKLKVGSVIQRDLLAAAALSGIDLSGRPFAPAPGLARGPAPRPLVINPGLGSAGMQPPAPYPFPIPFPYARPHP